LQKHTEQNTEWRRPIGCLKLQVIFRKRATNYKALLRKILLCVFLHVVLYLVIWECGICKTQERSTRTKYNTQEHVRRTTWKDTHSTPYTSLRNARCEAHELAYLSTGYMHQTTEQYCDTLQHTATHCNTLQQCVASDNRAVQERSAIQNSTCNRRHRRTPTVRNTQQYATHNAKHTNSHLLTGYGVALVSRIDKIIGLFCKRTL